MRYGFIDKNGGSGVPLEKIQIRGNIKGFTAEVLAIMEYKNNSDSPIEAIYVFPLDEEAAVCGFQATIDGRTIVAEIQEKQEARDTYDDAISSGHSAFLLEESDESSDIFQINVGNLPPKQSATVELTFVTTLSVEKEGRAVFVLPAVLNPRYSPSDSKPSVSTTLPTIASVSTKYSFDFVLEVQCASLIEEITSPCNPLKVDINPEDNRQATVRLGEEFKFDADVQVHVLCSKPFEPHALVENGVTKLKDGIKDEFLSKPVIMLNFFPELDSSATGEFIFVVDRSGSMSGSNIKSARETLLLFIKSLPEGCYFNVIGFGSSFTKLFPKSESYDDSSLNRACSHGESMQADLGGTKILAPLQDVFSQPLIKGFPRQVFLLTDGEVRNTQQVIELVFHLWDWCIVMVIKVLKNALQPALLDCQVTWDLPEGCSAKSIPDVPPPIFSGNSLIMYGLMSDDSLNAADSTNKGSITLSATLVTGAKVENIQHKLSLESLSSKSGDDSLLLHRLVAKVTPVLMIFNGGFSCLEIISKFVERAYDVDDLDFSLPLWDPLPLLVLYLVRNITKHEILDFSRAKFFRRACAVRNNGPGDEIGDEIANLRFDMSLRSWRIKLYREYFSILKYKSTMRYGFIDKNGGSGVPLEKIQIRGNIKGFTAEVLAIMEYKNNSDSPIEAIYVFPLDEEAAVCGFQATIDGRTIVAEIQEKQEARDTYDDAISSGHSAFLLEESDESSDIFQINVGNLPPKQSATVQLTFVTTLNVEKEGRAVFLLPAVLNPRYSPSDSKPSVSTTLPTIASVSSKYSFDFVLEVQCASLIEEITSPCNPLKVDINPEDNRQATVRLGEEFKFDADVQVHVLCSKPFEPHALVENGVIKLKDGIKDEFLSKPVVMLNFFPELDSSASLDRDVFSQPLIKGFPRQVFLLTDGRVIKVLKNALQPALLDCQVTWDLPEGCSAKSIPDVPPPIFSGNSLIMYGLMSDDSLNAADSNNKGSITLSATLATGAKVEKIQHKLRLESLSSKSGDDSLLLHRLAAKVLIQEKQVNDNNAALNEEIVNISKSANVVSKLTSFVVVDKDSNIPVCAPLAMPTFKRAPFRCMAVSNCEFRLRRTRKQESNIPVCAFIATESKVKNSDDRDLAMPPPLPRRVGQCLLSSRASARRVMNSDRSSASNAYDPTIENRLCESMDRADLSASSSLPQKGCLEIVSLQKASGAWQLTAQLASICGVTLDKLKQTCPSQLTTDNKDSLWATAIALSCLAGKFADQKDEWEMVAAKGTKWLKANLHKDGVDCITEHPKFIVVCLDTDVLATALIAIHNARCNPVPDPIQNKLRATATFLYFR
ncbi:hypothetical protein QZH41_002609 [Actinostola sp. cb2023]|nr:hypothetical protein QZH41_002609 [Actinostola sp. cb2023]